MADGGKLVEAVFGSVEGIGSFVESTLLEKGSPEHKLRISDLGDHVDPVAQEVERLAGLLLCRLDLSRAQVDLRQ